MKRPLFRCCSCGTAAALRSGVTTVVEHTHARPVISAADLEEKRQYLAGRSRADSATTPHIDEHPTGPSPEDPQPGHGPPVSCAITAERPGEIVVSIAGDLDISNVPELADRVDAIVLKHLSDRKRLDALIKNLYGDREERNYAISQLRRSGDDIATSTASDNPGSRLTDPL